MTAWYNEIDRDKAAWLRELIRRDLIAPGVVDERDIRDVAPIELAGFTQCHFFAGIGIWSYAARCAGWPDDRPLWTGSCPCQPFSSAGKGDGFDDERHLWPAWHWLIGQQRPDVVLGEQVASPDGLNWLDLVSADMEGTNYTGGAGDICSAGFGAPDIRQRLYMAWLADAGGKGSQLAALRGSHRSPEGEGRRSGPAERHGGAGGLVDATGAGRQGHRRGARSRTASAQRTGENHGMADTDGAGAARHGRDGGALEAEGGLRPGSADSGGPRGVADASRDGDRQHARKLPGDESQHEIGGENGDHASVDRGSVGGLAHADLAGHEPGGLPAGQRRPGQGEALEHGGGEAGWASPLKGFWGDADWLYCRDGWWRPVEPGTFPLAHGTPARVVRLRGYGEGINAQVATAFIQEVMAEIDQ